MEKKKGLSKPTEGKRQLEAEQQCWTFSREGNYKTFPAAQCFQASADPFLVPTWHQLISLLQLIIPWGLAWYSFPLYSKQRWRAEKPLGDSTVPFKSRFCTSSPSISFLSPPHRFYHWPAPYFHSIISFYFFSCLPIWNQRGPVLTEWVGWYPITACHFGQQPILLPCTDAWK